MARSNSARAAGAASGAGPSAGNKRRALAVEPGLATAELDQLIHQRTRLAIVSALAGSRSLSFNELKSLLGLSDGNLSVHTRKLEQAGYLTSEKSFSDRIPLTEYSLTAKGRSALEGYLDHMQALIEAARG